MKRRSFLGLFAALACSPFAALCKPLRRPLPGCHGGTFTLTDGEFRTRELPFNATPETIQAALDELPNISAGDVSVCDSGLWRRAKTPWDQNT